MTLHITKTIQGASHPFYSFAVRCDVTGRLWSVVKHSEISGGRWSAATLKPGGQRWRNLRKADWIISRVQSWDAAGREAIRKAREAHEPSPCRWWVNCTSPATTTHSHPILGDVPICDRCDAKVRALEVA